MVINRTSQDHHNVQLLTFLCKTFGELIFLITHQLLGYEVLCPLNQINIEGFQKYTFFSHATKSIEWIKVLVNHTMS